MSLVVKLNRFKVLKCKNEKYARLEFRGTLQSALFAHTILQFAIQARTKLFMSS